MFSTFEDLPELARTEYANVHEYVAGFLTEPHPFREGSVCPFVRRALQRKKIKYTLVSSATPTDVDSLMKRALQLQYSENKTGAIILLFPKGTKSKVLGAAQRRNKLTAVDMGLMLGALSLDDNSPSLHSQVFFPLRAPQPIIVVRDMVYTDIVFLGGQAPNRSDRRRFIAAFINKFADDQNLRVKDRVTEARNLLHKTPKRWWESY